MEVRNNALTEALKAFLGRVHTDAPLVEHQTDDGKNKGEVKIYDYFTYDPKDRKGSVFTYNIVEPVPLAEGNAGGTITEAYALVTIGYISNDVEDVRAKLKRVLYGAEYGNVSFTGLAGGYRFPDTQFIVVSIEDVVIGDGEASLTYEGEIECRVQIPLSELADKHN